jgi:hypothetical protein
MYLSGFLGNTGEGEIRCMRGLHYFLISHSDGYGFVGWLGIGEFCVG